jgi:hypothetical protein
MYAPNKNADKDQHHPGSIATVSELTLTYRQGKQKGMRGGVMMSTGA